MTGSRTPSRTQTRTRTKTPSTTQGSGLIEQASEALGAAASALAGVTMPFTPTMSPKSPQSPDSTSSPLQVSKKPPSPIGNAADRPVLLGRAGGYSKATTAGAAGDLPHRMHLDRDRQPEPSHIRA